MFLVFGDINEGHKAPYLIECPFIGTSPNSVSLVANPCDHAENNLKVLDIQPVDGVKRRFGVCSKQVFFDSKDSAIRFIEWVHMIRILGAEKIHFYYKYLHHDFFDIVQFFEKQGIVEALPYFDPSGISDVEFASCQTNMIEMNMLTDCFYRVKNLYDYVAVLDFDEVIMPVNEADMSWEDILKRFNDSEYHDAYISENLYYPEVGADPIEEVPSFMYMLQHIQRSQNFSDEGNAVKSLFGTERVLTVHNHSPHHCINDDHWCNLVYIPTNISQNSHYRNEMDKGTNFHITKVDKTIWKFKDVLLQEVQKTLKDTGFRP
jgi:Glycosyltransferase family 92